MKTQSNAISVVLSPGQGTQLLPPNDRRIGLLINTLANPNAALANIAFGVNASVTSGIRLPPSNSPSPLMLFATEIGTAIQQQINWYATDEEMVVSIVEFLASP